MRQLGGSILPWLLYMRQRRHCHTSSSSTGPQSPALNAAAVIFTHNHPSGMPEPSRADLALTKRLQDALALVDVRVLDHIVVGGS
jgi:hypothetical protein